MDTALRKQYLEAAEGLGYDTSSPKSIRQLMSAIRYAELWVADRRLTDRDICEQIHLSPDQLREIKESGAVKVATQMLFTEFMDDQKRRDIRAELFQVYQDNYAQILRNMARIARGGIIATVGEGDDKHDIRAGFKEQVAAASFLDTSRIAEAWVANTFLGERSPNQISGVASELLDAPKVLKLDERPIDAEVKVLEES